MRVRFTPAARDQFLAAIVYIQRDNPAAARRFRKRAEKSLRGLIRFPGVGRAVPEFPELPFRELIISPWRFFYRVKAGTIWIAAVWHGAQVPDDRGRG